MNMENGRPLPDLGERTALQFAELHRVPTLERAEHLPIEPVAALSPMEMEKVLLVNGEIFSAEALEVARVYEQAGQRAREVLGAVAKAFTEAR